MSTADQYTVSEDEKLWGAIAWILLIVGAIIVLLLKPVYKYAKHWAYLSISFFMVMIVAVIIGEIFALIPIIGHIVKLFIYVVLAIVWILGVVKSINKEWWNPPIVYDIAKAIGLEKL